ncbi:MAG: hypothetical protein KME20_01410 [Kaiparowitsia implicata GSE-PSE-MK54-09C]|jgi:hypothetical protein|nr:hypothetical protein [Kaiparowitsia implicata GSE-PSE-MK54-09C]
MVLTRKMDSKSPRAALQEEKKVRDFLSFLALAGIAVQGINLLIAGGLFLQLSNLASKPMPQLIQMADGSVSEVTLLGNQDRAPAVIQKFVADTLQGLMSWNNQIPVGEKDGEPQFVEDPGQPVTLPGGQKGKVTSVAWQSSFAFSEEMAAEMMIMVAEMTPPEVFRGTAQTALQIDSLTFPKRISDSEGLWTVGVVARIIIVDQSGNRRSIPFRKIATVKAVDTPRLPQEGRFASALERIVQSARRAQLEIVSLKDFESLDEDL